MSAQRTLDLALALAEPVTRARVAAELARHLGVRELLVLAPDPEISTLLPAPGWPQTIPSVAALRSALETRTAPGVHRLRARRDGEEVDLFAVRSNDGIVLVLVGGEPGGEHVAELVRVFPMLAAMVRAELDARVAEGNAASAREATRSAHNLAHALDATRAQLEISLRLAASLHDEADRAKQRVALLDRVTRELVGEVCDVDGALARIAELVVPSLADACAVYVPDGDGNVRLAALSNADEVALARARSLVDERWGEAVAFFGVGEVLRTGVTRHVPEITDRMLQEVSRDDAQLRELRAWSPRSRLTVALKGHDRMLGVLDFTSTSSRAFTADDRALAEEIANRAALLLEQRRLLDEARAARIAAECANRSKDEFLAMLGHELRNPLAPIVTALSLMKMRGDDGHDRERAVIERQIRHVVQLVDDLLDVSRITRGKIELRRETLNVRDVVATAAEMALPLIEERRHRLTVEVEGNLFVDGDARRLAQVVSNLLNNAAKYTPAGGHLELYARREGDAVVIRVRDDGIGIDEDLLPRLFDLFTQAPRALDRTEGGLGLGLAIVKSLVELHGGSVAAHSAGHRRGSELVVRLPTVAADEQVTVRAPASSAAVARKRRILVVDDNEDAAWLFTQLLRELDHEVEMAFDGPSALKILDRFEPDAALLDIGLPVMDGFELARRVRARLPHVFLVAVTGYGQAADRAATREAGFDVHLVKPVDIDDVSRILDAAPLARTA